MVFKAADVKKRSLFGRLAVEEDIEEDPEDVDTDDVEDFDAEKTLEHHTNNGTSGTLDELD